MPKPSSLFLSLSHTHTRRQCTKTCAGYSVFSFLHSHTHTHPCTKRLSLKVRTPACGCSHRRTSCSASPLSFFIVCLWCPMCARWLSFNPSQHTHTHTLACMYDAAPSSPSAALCLAQTHTNGFFAPLRVPLRESGAEWRMQRCFLYILNTARPVSAMQGPGFHIQQD